MPGLKFPSMPSSEGVEGDDVAGIGSLSPLPFSVHSGLTAISFFSFLSFVTSVSLFTFLCYRLMLWRKKTHHAYNQFVILIMNLLLADIQQSLAFLLNVQWVANNRIDVKSPTCMAQGWFVSTGDLASGVWCFTIAAHTMAAILFNARLKQHYFYMLLITLWLFVYVCAIISLSMHHHLYVRAGAWCWVNEKYPNVRLYLHYLWIFIAELGVVLIYAFIYIVLLRRIRQGFYRTDAMAKRARDVAKLMAAYPLIYVICTLPLASARTAAMAGNNVPIAWLLFAGAMITSNGWLDVGLYAVTRRILIFSDEPPSEECGIETFAPLFVKESRFGTVTEITAAANEERAKKSGSVLSRANTFISRKASVASWRSSASDGSVNKAYRSGSAWDASRSDVRGGLIEVPSMETRKEITVTVTSEDVQMEDLEELQHRGLAEENVMNAPLRREDHMALEFESKPDGF